MKPFLIQFQVKKTGKHFWQSGYISPSRTFTALVYAESPEHARVILKTNQIKKGITINDDSIYNLTLNYD